MYGCEIGLPARGKNIGQACEQGGGKIRTKGDASNRRLEKLDYLARQLI